LLNYSGDNHSSVGPVHQGKDTTQTHQASALAIGAQSGLLVEWTGVWSTFEIQKTFEIKKKLRNKKQINLF